MGIPCDIFEYILNREFLKKKDHQTILNRTRINMFHKDFMIVVLDITALTRPSEESEKSFIG